MTTPEPGPPVFLRRWLGPPPAQSSDEGLWRAWLAQRIIGVILLVSVTWLAISLFRINPNMPGAPSWPTRVRIATLLLAAGSAAALWALGRPALRDRAVLLWNIGLWLFALALMTSNPSVLSAHAMGLTLLMIASALLLGPRLFIWFAALAIAIEIILFRLDIYTHFRLSEAELPWRAYWLARIIGVVVSAMTLFLYNRTIHFSMQRSRRELQERQETEAALRESQKAYQDFIERTFEGVWRIDFIPPIALDTPAEIQVNEVIARGAIAEANDVAARMYGLTGREQLLGSRLADIFAASYLNPIRAAMLDLAKSGFRGAEVEMPRHELRYGKLVPVAIFVVNVSGVIVSTPAGEALASLWGSQRDISVRRQYQQALQRRNEQLDTLNRLGAAISTLQDLDGVLRVILERLREVLPLDVCYVGLFEGEDFVNIRFELMFDGGRFWPAFNHVIEPGDWLYPVIAERRSLLKNRSASEVRQLSENASSKRVGDLNHISASMIAIPLQVGARLIGLLSVQSYAFDAYTPEHLEFLDLAGYHAATAIENARLYEDLHRELFERQRAEAALQQFNAELEARVQVRTADLEKAMRELEAFSYSVSHDLRTPLRAIDGYSRFLIEDYADRLDEEGLGFLNNVRKSAQRMGVLIDDLLDLSRVTRQELHVEQAALSEMAAEIVERLRAMEPERQVEVRLQPGLTARGDPRLLRLALQNLFDNAWKFTRRNREAPARIEFGAQERPDGRAYFVRDNGAGFDMRYAGNLFKPFSRLHGVDEFEGTGVGLASVKRVIERHAGRVWAESAPGQGAVFWFTLGEAG